jgi:protein O-GlcNAc transferase
MKKPGIDEAVKHHLEGRLDAAETIYRRILVVEPANPSALHLLGVLVYQRKQLDEAQDLIERAIAFNKRIPEFHNNLGNVFLAKGRLMEAEACYRKALKLNPKYSDAHNNLGNVFRNLNRLDKAVASYRTALRLDPERAEIHNNLGMILEHLGHIDEAINHYRESCRLKPDFCDPYCNLGSALKAQGKLQEAIDCCSKALAINPTHALSLFNMGNALTQGGNVALGIDFYRRALAADPNLGVAHLNVGHALHEEGKKEEGEIHLQRALKLKPDSLEVQFGYCIRRIPLIHDSENEIEAARKSYGEELEKLRKAINLSDPEVIPQASRIVGNHQPFFLAYQGLNDRDLQASYGSLIARIQGARYPAWSKKRRMPPHRGGEPLRIGIASGFYFLHSNWKIPIKGWLSNINRNEFQLFGYYTGRTNDTQTVIARSLFCRFSAGISSLDQWCEQICNDRLHVLIFPEVGMDPMTVRMASLRLAPIQCISWGHPDTSGLPTIDYYLSSDLMEPPDAENHYTERLVRLPNLSIYYEPIPIDTPPVDRSHFGLRENAVLFLCVQSLFKYLPQFDDVFPRIALEAGDCQFAFLSFVKSAHLGERFVRRLESAFSHYGLKSEDYVKFLPHLPPPQYQALNRLADVFLDSIGWSGCNSTLEALSHNLPVVTLPGTLMRGRHSYAILRMAGLDELIAPDIDRYVALAGQLGRDVEARKQISEKISQLKHRVYCDTECVRGLEKFLKDAVTNFSEG